MERPFAVAPYSVCWFGGGNLPGASESRACHRGLDALQSR
jgi:hypothetical protein